VSDATGGRSPGREGLSGDMVATAWRRCQNLQPGYRVGGIGL